MSNINDIPECISGVENDCSGIVRYGNNNISFINIYDVIVMYFTYNSIDLVTALDTISSPSGRSFVCLSSELAPIKSLSSNIYRLSRDCGLVHLDHVPIALEASLEITSPLSSYSLSPGSRFLFRPSPGLFSCSSSSHTKCPSSISFSVPTIAPSFGPSIAPIINYFTRHIDNILFLHFNTESFLLHSYNHIHDHGVVLVSRI